MVGTSGSAFERCAPNKASGRALPALIWERLAEIDDTSICELLPRNAVSAGPPPWVGKCLSFKPPAAAVEKAVGVWSAPENPDELKTKSVWRLFAASTSSFSLLF